MPFWETAVVQISFEPNSGWNAKQLSMHKILSGKKPRTVLDIASGSGWFSELAAQFSDYVAAFDTDPEAVVALVRQRPRADLPILPLVMDFTRPTPVGALPIIHTSRRRIVSSARWFSCSASA